MLFSMYHVRSLKSAYLIVHVTKDKARLRTKLNRLKTPDNYIHAFTVALRNILEIIGE